MTSTIRFLDVSMGITLFIGLMLTVMLALFVAVPYAQAAESPNILVGENMTIGSTGPGVVVLQGLLAEDGYLNIPMGVPMGYYGALTQAALARYQNAQNVTPAVGYFGPLTKVAIHMELLPGGWLTKFGW
jgi:hypothetical protein